MMRDGNVIGVMVLTRSTVRPFTDKQIELVETFADQAVIAIENTRLLNELRRRTDDLTESLEQQTATSEVLQIISSSPGELQPVFSAMLANACRICEAKFGNLLLYDGEMFRVAVAHGSSEWIEFRLRSPEIRPGAIDPLGRLAATGQVQHIADVRLEQVYRDGFAPMVELADVAGARTLLLVPMRRETQLVGVIAIYRQEIRAFTDRHIELVQNFAAQAVIAIENTRLLNELRQRTDDLSDRWNSRPRPARCSRSSPASPGDLQPVFQAMLANATRICRGEVWKSSALRRARHVSGWGTAWCTCRMAELRRRNPVASLHPNSPLARVARTKQPQHVTDSKQEDATLPTAQRRTVSRRPSVWAAPEPSLCVPMLKDDELVGAFVIYRQEVRPFTDKQIELVQNFAAQAVIAIENTRLLRTSCVSRWSSKRPPAKCSKRSRARLANWSRYSLQYWRTPLASARQASVT